MLLTSGSVECLRDGRLILLAAPVTQSCQPPWITFSVEDGLDDAQAGHTGPPGRGLLTALAIGSVALAWTSVHTVYVLRYARLYYSPPEGGIDFHGETPDYVDFAYLGLTIGMTFQVSDTDLTGKRIRRVALHHALLSYLFGTGIVAIAVSSVATLLGR